jgi:hypothetical protein
MKTIILASNRCVDITLSNVGQASQESARQYPFNAADSLTLLKEEQTKKTGRPRKKQALGLSNKPGRTRKTKTTKGTADQCDRP